MPKKKNFGVIWPHVDLPMGHTHTLVSWGHEILIRTQKWLIIVETDKHLYSFLALKWILQLVYRMTPIIIRPVHFIIEPIQKKRRQVGCFYFLFFPICHHAILLKRIIITIFGSHQRLLQDGNCVVFIRTIIQGNRNHLTFHDWMLLRIYVCGINSQWHSLWMEKGYQLRKVIGLGSESSKVHISTRKVIWLAFTFT